MSELENFYNEGFGWVCRACERALKPPGEETGNLSRLFREGEAENKTPRFSNSALAKWTDAARTRLECPRCGITQEVKVKM